MGWEGEADASSLFSTLLLAAQMVALCEEKGLVRGNLGDCEAGRQLVTSFRVQSKG